MTHDQMIVFSIIFCAMAMFVWGKIRYDLVAASALVVAVLSGIVPANEAFEGFGHAAVITVAAVLIISKALQNSGFVDHLVQWLAPTQRSVTTQIAASTTLGASLSCVMNNVGALAFMLPVTLRNALKAGRSPSLLLIPLSFASLLGGLVTLIGTPPNIVVATYRQSVAGEPFSMFDFSPVGLIVAVAGLLYLTFIGWRLLPERVHAEVNEDHLIHVEAYSFESQIPEGSPLIGRRVRDLERMTDQELTVLAIIRDGNRRLAPHAIEKFREGDILILEGDVEIIQPLADGKQLARLGHKVDDASVLGSDDVKIVEAILLPNSPIDGRSMRGVRMHDRYNVNLLAVSRAGKPATARLKNTTFKSGDILLLQGETLTMDQTLKALGCLPLAERGLQPFVPSQQSLLPFIVFAFAIGIAATGWVTVPIAFVMAVCVLVGMGAVSASEAYSSVEWPVIVLLAALIPIGEALQHTGGTDLIAQALLTNADGAPVWLVLTLLLAVSMWLSDLVHNTPTAILMAPIAVSVANGLGQNPDAFLMAIAVGAASPYLTPIGHQSNTLVMGPGGYRFSDYARVGAPLQVIILVTAVPALMYFWM